MAAIGRIALIAAVALAPWIFGSVQPWPQFWLATVVAVLTACRLIEVLTHRPEQSVHIPLAGIAPLGLLLLAAVQLLPRADNPAANMAHAVYAEDAELFSGPGDSSSGTLSAASTRREAGRLYFALAAFLLAAHWFATQDSFRLLFGGLAFNGLALGIFGIIQRLSWNGKLFWSVDLRFGGTPFASFVNRNNAAGYLNLCLAAAIGFAILLLGTKPRGTGPSFAESASQLRLRFWDRLRLALAGLQGRHLVVAGCLGILVAAVLFSLSRGGILAMGIAAVALIATAARGVNRQALLALSAVVGVAACGLLVAAGGLETVDKRIATLSDPLSAASGRLQHWQDTFGAVRDFPFLGTGLGTYRFANQPYQTRPAHAWYYNADNEWFEILVEAGAVGLIAALSGFVLIGVSSLSLLKQKETAWQAMGAVGLFAVLSQGIQAITDFGLIVPANGLTVAVIGGAVCGAACRAAEFHRLRVPVSLSLAQLDGRITQALWGGVLVLASATFLLELFTATKAGAARDVLITTDSDPAQIEARIESLDAAIAGARTVARYRPDDAELHASMGRWFVDRYQLQMYRELLTEVTEPDRALKNKLWETASLPVLALRARQLEAAGQTAELARLLGSPAVADNLPAAREHFQESLRHCPLGRGVSLALTRLSFLQGTSNSVQALGNLLRTRFVAPSSPSVLMEAGMLASASGEMDLADRCWRRALEISPEDGLMIWKYAVQTSSPEDVMKDILPPRPDVFVNIAEEIPEGEVRQMIIRRAKQLLEQASESDFSGSNHAILSARLAELQSLPKLAIRHYQLALSDQPWQIDWRLRLARLLHQQGRLSEADREYSLLSGQAPTRRDIQAERRSLQLEIAEQRIRQRPTVDPP